MSYVVCHVLCLASCMSCVMCQLLCVMCQLSVVYITVDSRGYLQPAGLSGLSSEHCCDLSIVYMQYKYCISYNNARNMGHHAQPYWCVSTQKKIHMAISSFQKNLIVSLTAGN